MPMVGRVDWDVAHMLYIQSSKYSYSRIGSMYGVSKSTIQQYATKHKWTEDREVFRLKRIDNLLTKFDTDLDQVHAKHLKTYRTLAVVSHNALLRLQKQYENKPIDGEYSRSLSSITRSMGVAITEERILLGLPTKGFAADPWSSADSAKNMVHVSDEEIEEHIKRYERYVKRIRRRTDKAIG